MEAVRFKTYDEVELAANLYVPQGADGWCPAIIVCHGFGSCKENYAAFGERAVAAGMAALIMDLRGHGESGGQLDGNVFNDVAAALQFLLSRGEINPTRIAIRGSSLGAWLAIHTAAHLKDLSPVIGVATTNEAQMTILLEEVALVQRGHTSPMVPHTLPRVDVNAMTQLLYRLDIQKAVRKIQPRPLLLIHCEGDDQVPAHTSQRIYDEATEPKALWLLPGGDHRFAQHDPEIDRRMLDWLRISLPTSGSLAYDV